MANGYVPSRKGHTRLPYAKTAAEAAAAVFHYFCSMASFFAW